MTSAPNAHDSTKFVEPMQASKSTSNSVPMVASFRPVCFRVLGGGVARYGRL
jgi:hypothetical protein